MDTPAKKLTLAKETINKLDDAALDGVAAGIPAANGATEANSCVSKNGTRSPAQPVPGP